MLGTGRAGGAKGNSRSFTSFRMTFVVGVGLVWARVLEARPGAHGAKGNSGSFTSFRMTFVVGVGLVWARVSEARLGAHDFDPAFSAGFFAFGRG